MATEISYQPEPFVKMKHPAWCKNASIYQINTRQFTAEGTFKAAEAQLPRLKALGIDIVWLMPVHPIGQKNRKGTLGSPYSVRDYYGVNPEFGTLDDLKNFVKTAHNLGLYVILDWVANHTAWDNPLVEAHPDWYLRDWKGDFRPTPWWDWEDIIDLDYDKPEVRQYMTEALLYWVREVDIDGYRCDVAGFVPVDFWNTARKAMEAVKPVFLLAEWESQHLHAEAFDMTYSWTWNDAVQAIANGHGDVNKLYIYYSWNEKAYPADIMRMMFVSNHDKNAWEGTEFELFGPALEATIVLTVVSEGMPLIYNGQEAGNPKRLAFFEKDPIEWRDHPHGELYRKLLALKKQNSALWNAGWGARMVRVPSSKPNQILSFVRQNAQDKVFVLMNFSGEAQTFTLKDALYYGTYVNFFSGEKVQFPTTQDTFTLPAWGFLVFVK
jgi:glycosidase